MIGIEFAFFETASYYYGMSVVRQLPKVLEHARDLRKRLTDAEKVLWNILRDRKFLGYKFRRQAPVGRFIADFLCNNPPLIIEVDGPIHIGQAAQDAERTEGIFADYEIPVLRLTNEEVLENLPFSLKKIEESLIESREKSAPKSISQ